MNAQSLTGALRETLAVFSDPGTPLTTPEVADVLDLGRRATYSRLEQLVDANRLETKKVGANARVWWRPLSDETESGDGTDGGVDSPREDGRREFERMVDAVEEYAIFTLDTEGRVRSWNPGAENIKGYDADEILGEHFSVFYTEADREASVPAENLARAATQGEIEDEGWRVRDDGSQFWANVTLTAIRDEDGSIDGYAKVTRDMTQRREYEQHLETQAERLERRHDELERELDDVFERISDGFYALDEEFRLLYLNDHARDVLGLDDAAIGRKLVDVVTITDTFGRALHEARETQESLIFEDYYQPVDRWFENALYPSESGLSVYFREITDQKERERELERSRELLRHTEQLAEVGGWETDLETGEQRWTTGLFDIHDVDVEEADEQQVPAMEEYFSFVSPEHREEFRRAVERTLTAGEPYDEEIRITTREGRERWIRTRGEPIVEDGEVVALRGAARDITDDRERERQLSTLINDVPGMVYRCRNEPGWPVEFASAACRELTGYDPEALESGEIEWTEDVLSEESCEPVWGTVQRETGEGTAFSETYRIETADGEYRWVKDFRRVVETAGECGLIEGIVEDVTEEVEREHKLEQYEQIVETVTDGIYVLDGNRQFTLINDEFASMTGYARTELIGAPAKTVFGEEFVEVADEKQLQLESGEIDVAVLEEKLYRADDTALTVESRFNSFEGPDGETGRVGVVRDVSDRVAREQELEALNSINEVSNEITDAVIEKSTREEIETAVCEHLADSESYLFAWVGDVDSTTEIIHLRTEAGVQGYLDDVTISVDPDDERSQGPTGRALLTGEMQTTQDIDADSRHDPWREQIESYGFRSSAAIPIVHGESVYGVLNVYAERPRAFEGREGELIARIGEVMGHAIAATERKRALMSDEVVELKFQLRDVFELVGVAPIDGRIALDYAVPRGDEEFLVFGTAAPGAIDTVRALTDEIPHWDAVTVLSEGEVTNFEVWMTEPPVLSVVAALGGYIDSFVIEDGDLSMSIHLSPGVEARRASEAVTEAYPPAQMVRRRQISRPESGTSHAPKTLVADLTDRQRAVLDAAYHAGYFEWPRNADGSDVAEALGIAPSTFSHHLRKAEQKVLDALYTSLDRER